MSYKVETSAVIDGLLKLLLLGGTVSATILAPNALVALDKPLQKAFKKFDERERERELKRILNYMKFKGLIDTANYEHGITITKAGRERAKKINLATLTIPQPSTWDKQWRIVFFDIPESKRNERIAFSSKLRRLGFKPLQLSTWIYPFPCRQEIEVVTSYYKIQKYVSYIETSFIDNPKPLIKKFANILK